MIDDAQKLTDEMPEETGYIWTRLREQEEAKALKPQETIVAKTEELSVASTPTEDFVIRAKAQDGTDLIVAKGDISETFQRTKTQAAGYMLRRVAGAVGTVIGLAALSVMGTAVINGISLIEAAQVLFAPVLKLFGL